MKRSLRTLAESIMAVMNGKTAGKILRIKRKKGKTRTLKIIIVGEETIIMEERMKKIDVPNAASESHLELDLGIAVVAEPEAPATPTANMNLIASPNAIMQQKQMRHQVQNY